MNKTTSTRRTSRKQATSEPENVRTGLSVPEINGIQWVQEMGIYRPIMQWVPLIQKIQAAGKGVIVDLQVEELEPFLDAVDPKGIFLWVGTDDEDTQLAIIKRLEKWH